MFLAVVSLRPMFSLFHCDNNTNDNNTVTKAVTGRWWLSGEHEKVQPH